MVGQVPYIYTAHSRGQRSIMVEGGTSATRPKYLAFMALWRLSMRKSTALLFLALSIAVVSAVSCGGSMSPMTQQRFVQSVTVTPSAADAAKSHSGMVQFMATGNFNMAPMTAPISVQWFLGMPGSPQMPAGVSIDMNGMAQCSGFIGMVPITAAFAGNPDVHGTAAQVFGTAQLTCP